MLRTTITPMLHVGATYRAQCRYKLFRAIEPQDTCYRLSVYGIVHSCVHGHEVPYGLSSFLYIVEGDVCRKTSCSSCAAKFHR